MTRSNDLQTLLGLRQARLQRAQADLARQQAHYAATRERATDATARLLAHRDRQSTSETAMLDDLIGRAATLNDIERMRMNLAALEDEAAALDREERDAAGAMRESFERKQVLARDRDRRRREEDRMGTLVGHLRRVERRNDELRAEVDQEERASRAIHQARPC